MLKTMNRNELVRLIETNANFKLLDVLDTESYNKGHIKGSISMPLKMIGRNAPKMLNKSDMIVTYCASFDCKASTEAAEKLIKLGYTNVYDYKGGLKDFQETGLPLEKTFNKDDYKDMDKNSASCD